MFIEANGYLLKSKEYINNKEKLKLECPNGHEYLVAYSNFKKGTRCSHCSNNYRKPLEELRKERVGSVYNELKLIRYIENGKYEFQCSCGELCIKPYGDVNSGKIKSCGHLNKQRMSPNVEGTKYNKLLAVKELEIVNGQREYLFRCDCGKEVVRKLKEVKRGKLKSCGCGVFEGAKLANTTHGMTNSRIYNIWNGMKERCLNKNNSSYHHYGGRGIAICDEWLNNDGFITFYKWAVSNGYDDELTIDRIDVNGNYSPLNCRWATLQTQANNKRSTVYYEYNGERKSLTEWSDDLGLTYDSLWKRLNKYNYSFEKAITYNIHKIKDV